MKKSLLVTLDFPPAHIGGVSLYYKNLCENLPFDKIIVLAPFHETKNLFDRNVHYTIYRKKLLSGSWYIWPKWLPAIREIQNVIQKENIEHILVGNILPLGTVAGIIKKQKNVHFSTFIHGMDLSCLYGRKKWLAKKILESSDFIFTNSLYTKHLVTGFGLSDEKIVVAYPCPNPLPEPNELEIIKMRNLYGLHDKKILLTVGRLVQRKGHDRVLQSLPKISKKIDNIHYIIAGDGPEEQRLKKMVNDLHMEKYVTFIHYASDKQISTLYEICDVFIMVSRILKNNDYEGFGTVFLEANAFAKPVIGGNSGGVPEAIIHGYNGLLVNPLNTEEISSAVINLFENPHYANILGLQGLDRIYHKFQWWAEAQKLINSLT